MLSYQQIGATELLHSILVFFIVPSLKFQTLFPYCMGNAKLSSPSAQQTGCAPWLSYASTAGCESGFDRFVARPEDQVEAADAGKIGDEALQCQ